MGSMMQWLSLHHGGHEKEDWPFTPYLPFAFCFMDAPIPWNATHIQGGSSSLVTSALRGRTHCLPGESKFSCRWKWRLTITAGDPRPSRQNPDDMSIQAITQMFLRTRCLLWDGLHNQATESTSPVSTGILARPLGGFASQQAPFTSSLFLLVPILPEGDLGSSS